LCLSWHFIFFVGAWSDIVGRKVPLILSLLGTIFSLSFKVINISFEDWQVEYLCIGALSSFSGGTFSSGTFLDDSTTPKNRTFRMTFILGLTSAANAIGHYFNVSLEILDQAVDSNF
jgi:MFS family permease